MKLWKKVLVILLFLLAVPFMVVAGILITAISKITHGFNEEVSMKMLLLILAVSLGGCAMTFEEAQEEARLTGDTTRVASYLPDLPPAHSREVNEERTDLYNNKILLMIVLLLLSVYWIGRKKMSLD